MSTLRLYRELCKESEPQKDIFGKDNRISKDFSYEDERKQIFHDLGYDVAGCRAATKAPKYHGKAVRIGTGINSVAEIRSRRNRAKNIQDISKKLNDVLVKSTLIQDTMNQITGYVTNNKDIPRGLLPKLDSQISESFDISVHSTEIESKSSKNKSPSSNKTKLPALEDSFRCSVKMVPPSLQSGKGFNRIVHPDQSKNKWTRDEIDRLNDIYNSTEKPNSRLAVAWNMYYRSMAGKFLSFFPLRSEREVLQKINEMIAKKRFKEVGEYEYWNGFSCN